MALEGTLKEFGLADIFQLIFLQKKTGTLTIRWEKKRASVSFEGGMIVSAESSERLGPDRIGEILLKAEKITKDDLKEALKRQKDTGQKLGLLLEDLGLITKKDLQVALKLQVKETIFNLFRLKEGEYIFEQSAINYDKEYLSPMSTEFILMEGIRRIDEWPFAEKMIPSLDIIFEKNSGKKLEIPEDKKTEKVPTKDEIDFDDEEKEGGLSNDEINIYNLVDGKRDTTSIIAIGQMGDFETCKALANLLMGGYIKKVETGLSETKEGKLSPIITGIKEIRFQYLGLIDIVIFLAGMVIAASAFLSIISEPIGSELKNNLICPHITKNRIERIRNAMIVYQLNKGGIPGTINELVEAGYITYRESKDCWGEDIVFEKNKGVLSVVSGGADRNKGTSDDIR